MDYAAFNYRTMNEETTEIKQSVILTLSRLVPGKSEEDREKPQDNR
jgi:hypothetical protein